MINPLAQTDCGEIIWIAREGCTRDQARRWVADEAGEPVSGFTVGQCHIRQLTVADCPAHPHGQTDEDLESPEPECRCHQIKEGWWEECSHRHPDAIPCWRVEALMLPGLGTPANRRSA